MIVNILLTILLGMIPETLFFTLFLTYTKNLKNKRIKLFLLISLAYVLCVILMKYNVLFYILFVIGIYLSLKILYKNKIQIIDIFIISIGFIYICTISFVFSKFINNNYYNYYILPGRNTILYDNNYKLYETNTNLNKSRYKVFISAGGAFVVKFKFIENAWKATNYYAINNKDPNNKYDLKNAYFNKI